MSVMHPLHKRKEENGSREKRGFIHKKYIKKQRNVDIIFDWALYLREPKSKLVPKCHFQSLKTQTTYNSEQKKAPKT